MSATTPHDLWRLAEEAERRGIRIFVEPIVNEHFATSASDSTKLYRVTALSCTCAGFMVHQRCTHQSALLAYLGWLPDPEPPASPCLSEPIALPCPCCNGSGRDWAEGRDGLQVSITCPICEGRGEIEAIPGDDGEPADVHQGTATPDPGPRCAACFGEGYQKVHLGGHLDNWVAAPCRTCGETGRLLHAA